jgi:hypothetical protein
VDPGRYHLYVTRAGYATQEYGEGSSAGSNAILTLNPGKNISDLIFRMVPYGVISGRVTDEDGDPMADAVVMAMQSGVNEGRRKLLMVQTTVTNDLGEYRLYGLPRGRYYIRTEYADRQSPKNMRSTPDDSTLAAQTAYLPIFYPGTPDVSRASAVALSPGQELPSVHFRLIPTRAVRIRGRVFNAILGKPAGGCCVYLKPRDSMVESNTFAGPGELFGPNGAFEIDNVVPGAFFVVAAMFIERSFRQARVPIDVANSNLDDISLTISSGVELVGRVAIEGREPFDLSALRVGLAEAESDFPYVRPAEVKADGSFKFTDVSMGSYEVNVAGQPPGAYLKSARSNGEDILNGKLDVSPGGSRGPLEIVLSWAGHQLDGAVTDEDGLPIPGAMVVLIPSGDRRKQYRLYKSASTDQYGKFILRGIAAGDYKAFAWKDVEYDEWEDPEFLKPFESKGVEVRAEENEHSSLALKLIPSAAPKEQS